jgi:hypothetical protein
MKQLELFLFSPDDIRRKSEEVLQEKQNSLQWAFWTLAVGSAAALVLMLLSL